MVYFRLFTDSTNDLRILVAVPIKMSVSVSQLLSFNGQDLNSSKPFISYFNSFYG